MNFTLLQLSTTLTNTKDSWRQTLKNLINRENKMMNEAGFNWPLFGLAVGFFAVTIGIAAVIDFFITKQKNDVDSN